MSIVYVQHILSRYRQPPREGLGYPSIPTEENFSLSGRAANELVEAHYIAPFIRVMHTISGWSEPQHPDRFEPQPTLSTSVRHYQRTKFMK
jgi:hypothetical protein